MSYIIHQACQSRARHKATQKSNFTLYSGCPAKIKPSRENNFRKICTQPLDMIGMTYFCDAPGCKSKKVQAHHQDKLDLTGWIEHTSTTSVYRTGSFEMVQHEANIHFCSNKCKQKHVNDPRPIDSKFYQELKANKRMLDSLPQGVFVMERRKTV